MDRENREAYFDQVTESKELSPLTWGETEYLFIKIQKNTSTMTNLKYGNFTCK